MMEEEKSQQCEEREKPSKFTIDIQTYLIDIQLTGEGAEQVLQIRLTSKIDNSIRQGRFTVEDLPSKIKQFYEGLPVLKTLVEQMYHFQADYNEKYEDEYDEAPVAYPTIKDIFKISEEGQFIFIKMIKLNNGTVLEKKFILATKKMTEKQVISIIKGKMKKLEQKLWKQTQQQCNLRQENYDLKNKVQKFEVFSKIYSKQKIIEEKMKQFEKQNISYSFSQTLKDVNIQLFAEGKICQRKAYTGSSCVIINNSQERYFQKISLKMKKIANWIGFGIGLLDELEKSNFSGHWANITKYCISTNKQIHKKNRSQSYHEIELTTDNIVDIQLAKDFIIFNKRGNLDHVIALEIQFTEEQWKNVVFFVNMLNYGDSIEIVD